MFVFVYYARSPSLPFWYTPLKPCPFPQVAEYRSWTDEEIDQKVADCKMELFFLRMQLAARQEIKTHRFDALRKTVSL